jgi:hypothetical protein
VAADRARDQSCVWQLIEQGALDVAILSTRNPDPRVRCPPSRVLFSLETFMLLRAVYSFVLPVHVGRMKARVLRAGQCSGSRSLVQLGALWKGIKCSCLCRVCSLTHASLRSCCCCGQPVRLLARVATTSATLQHAQASECRGDVRPRCFLASAGAVHAICLMLDDSVCVEACRQCLFMVP